MNPFLSVNKFQNTEITGIRIQKKSAVNSYVFTTHRKESSTKAAILEANHTYMRNIKLHHSLKFIILEINMEICMGNIMAMDKENV